MLARWERDARLDRLLMRRLDGDVYEPKPARCECDRCQQARAEARPFTVDEL